MVNALPYSLLKPQVAQSRLQWMEEEQLCSDVPTATGSRFIEGGYRVQEAQVCSILLTQLIYFVAPVKAAERRFYESARRQV
jgi:hypothetical protein